MGALIKGLDGLSRGTLWFALLLAPLIALAGGLGFQAVGLLIGVSTFLVWIADRTGADYLKSFWPLALIVFLGWAWISSLWSPYEAKILGGNASILFALVLSLLFVPLAFLRLTPRLKSILSWVVILTSGVGVALILFDAISGYAFSIWVDPVDPGGDPIQRRSDAEMNLGRGQVSYAQLAWPIAALMMLKVKRGVWLAAALFSALCLSAYFNGLAIVVPALAVSAVFAALAWWKPGLGISLAFGLAISSLVFAPLLGILSSLIDPDTMRKLPLSWEHRVRMWAYCWELIQQAPLIGHGFDASRVYDERTFLTPDGRNIPVISMHPHNVGLQIWLETGVIGVVLICTSLALLVRKTLQTCQNSLRAMAIAGLISGTATCGAVTVGVWQHWWWALIILAVGLIIMLPHNNEAKIATP